MTRYFLLLDISFIFQIIQNITLYRIYTNTILVSAVVHSYCQTNGNLLLLRYNRPTHHFATINFNLYRSLITISFLVLHSESSISPIIYYFLSAYFYQHIIFYFLSYFYLFCNKCVLHTNISQTGDCYNMI